jgi:hypothetical protein
MNGQNIEAIYGLSPLQQGLLFHSIFESNSTAYLDQLNCALEGKLDPDAFARAWQRAAERHAVMRTAFVWKQERLLQVVLRKVKLPVEHLDWRHLSPERQSAELEIFLKSDRERGFDVSTPPLMRLSLVQLRDDLYRFVWSFHHLILDGWSRSLLVQEVLTFYEAFCRSGEKDLPRPRPYQDYILWLQQQGLNQAEEFWREYLKGFARPTKLRIEKASPNRSTTYNEQEVRLTDEVTENLIKATRELQVTVSTVIQAVWAILLSRYSGEQEVVFGITVSGRPAELAGIEEMIGLFINTLPVRVFIDGAREAGDWLRELQRRQTELLQYEYSPLPAIQKWSGAPRGASLINTIVTFQNHPTTAVNQRNDQTLRISEAKGVENTNYPLTIVSGLSPSLWLQLFYYPSHFEAAQITLMAKQLEAMLTLIDGSSGLKVGQFYEALDRLERGQELIVANHLQNVSALKYKSVKRKQLDKQNNSL